MRWWDGGATLDACGLEAVTLGRYARFVTLGRYTRFVTLGRYTWTLHYDVTVGSAPPEIYVLYV